MTWYGAIAYAKHYKKRLPTAEELREALLYLKQNTGPLKKANAGLQIKIGEMEEWAVGKGTLQKAGPGLRSPQEKFPYQSVILFKQPSLEKAVVEERFPWEGFTDVGFRCTLDPTSDNK